MVGREQRDLQVKIEKTSQILEKEDRERTIGYGKIEGIIILILKCRYCFLCDDYVPVIFYSWSNPRC